MNGTDISVLSEESDQFDRAIEVLMMVMLVFMPLAFGVVHAWSEQVIISLAGAMAFCLALKYAVRKGAGIVWTWSYVPMFLFVLLVVFQLVPLGSQVVESISPNTAAMKTSLLSDLPKASEILDSMTLSIYPWATRRELRLLLVAVTVFIVVVNVYRSERQITRLLSVIAIVGGGIAVLAIVGGLFGNGKIYWLIPTGKTVTYSGTFINHSHYGQFMNLSIGAALGLLLIKTNKKFSRRGIRPAGVQTGSGKGGMRVIQLLTAMIIIGVASVFVSLTRGGMISLLVAGVFTAMVLAWKQQLKNRNWIMAIVALGAFVCILYIGFEAVYDRLGSLYNPEKYKDRWCVVKDLVVLAGQFPVFGTGLGTLEMIYQMFESSINPRLMVYADNEYIQTMAETGMLGMNLVLIFVFIVCYNYYHSIRRVYVPVRCAAFGLGFGLLAVMLHSFSDYGQHIPANACLSAVFCGLMINLPRIERGHRHTAGAIKPQAETVQRIGARFLRVGLLLSVTVGWGWLLVQADKARKAEGCWKQAVQTEKKLVAEKSASGTGNTGNKRQVGSEEYAALVREARQAVNYQSRNVKYRYWLNVYRWLLLKNESYGSAISAEATAEIVADLHRSRALCPTFGPTYCVAGQLEKYILGNPSGAKHIRQSYYLRPNDATVCFTAGVLDVEEGRLSESLEKFRQYLSLGGTFNEVIDIYVDQENRPELAFSAAGNDTRRLISLSAALESSEKHRELANRVQKKTMDLLKKQCEQPNVSATTPAYLARLYYKQKKFDLAIEYFRRAIMLDYGRIEWRMALARILTKTNRIPEAIHETRVCLRLEPQMESAKKLLASLVVMLDEKTN